MRSGLSYIMLTTSLSSYSCAESDRLETPNPGALPPLPEVAADLVQQRFEERPARELQIALVGEVRGEIEPCGCPTLPYGGFLRRQVVLDELRATGALIQVDAGELLLKGLATRRSKNREERAAALMSLSADVGVDVWVPGPTDLLALGIDGIAALPESEAPPVASATWARPTAETLLPPTQVVERDGLRIGVVGLSERPSAPRLLEAMAPADPVAATQAALAALPADLDLFVAVGSISDEAADAVAAAVPELSLMLTTRGEELDAPRHVGPVTIVESPDRGRFLQVLTLRLGSTADAPVTFLPEPQDWRTRATLREQGDAESSALSELEARFDEVGRGRNLGWLRTIPLAPDLDGRAMADGDVAATVARFKEETLEKAVEVAASPPPEAESGYATAGRCVSCHRAEFGRWTLTDHARSWESLLSRGATEDPECIGCHSTGFGEPGGFGELTPSNVRRFKGVQCESCHGPMGGHPDDATVVSATVDMEACVGCHDPANSPGFAWESYLRRSVCQDLSTPAVPEEP